MPPRETKSVRIDPEVWSQFVSWVNDVEGQKYGELGRHVENALNEYINNDRAARIEERLDELVNQLSHPDNTHTHMSSQTLVRTKKIVERIVQNSTPPFKSDELERAIEDIAGGDDRTVRKYKSLMKKRGLLYEHPYQPVWTDDRDEFGKWLASNGADNHEVVEEYDMEWDELDSIIPEEVAP